MLNLELSKRKIGREIAFNIDETPDLNSIYDIDRFMRPARLSPDPATCVTVGDKFFLVGRVSGLVQKYSIPHVSLEA